MNKLMLLGSAALLALSGTAFAQGVGDPKPDSQPASPAPSATLAGPSEAGEIKPMDAAPAADPAMAQSTAPAADAPAAPAAPAATTAATDPAPATPTAPAAATASADPAAGAAPATSTANADAAAKVNADWAKYDEGNKGKLTPLEFGNWVMAARGQDMTAQVDKSKTSKKANLPAVKVLNATATDFAKADTDKDHAISPNELAVYLSA